MGLLDAAIQGRALHQQSPKYFADSVAGLKQTIDRNRIIKLGNELWQADNGDSS